MVQPAAMAGATFRAVCVSGKFQGVIIPTTPTGSLTRLIVERSEEHTSELQSRLHLVCRLLLEKKNKRRALHCLEQTFSYRRLLRDRRVHARFAHLGGRLEVLAGLCTRGPIACLPHHWWSGLM